MPLTTIARDQRPSYWWAFGHSYLENQLGTRDQTGRADAMFRTANDIEHHNWRNFAVTGSRLMQQGAAVGGYARMFQAVNKVAFGWPYVPLNGGAVLCWGINDIGLSGPGATYLAAFQDALRSVIGRWRAAVIYEDSNAIFSWGAGFVSTGGSSEWTSGTSYRTATALTNANFTITLPADYTGTPVSIVYNGIVNGGVITYTGTAGVTGTFNTNNIIPVGELSHAPRTHRITTLTASNAGQTIIGTVSSLTGGGNVDVDCFMIEAESPNPVIVMDIPRLPATGYTTYGAINANSEATNDGHVNTWNAGIATVVGEFDSMVQIAYGDMLLNKNSAFFWLDGVHTNEKGSALLADAMMDAQRRLQPKAATATNAPFGTTAFLNPASPVESALARLHQTGANTWYSPEFRAHNGATGTPFSVGEMWAIPFQITIPNARLTMFSIDQIAAGTVTGALRWGLYDDPGRTGYPFSLMMEGTSAGAFTTSLAAGVKTSPAPNTAGYIDKPLDPGVYWMVVKFTVAGTGQTFATYMGPNFLMQNVASTAGGRFASGTGGPMGYKLTGQGTTALPGRFPTGATPADSAPFLSFRLQ